MHSCELVVTPPVQGAALLVELGTLIIEGRTSKVLSNLDSCAAEDSAGPLSPGKKAAAAAAAAAQKDDDDEQQLRRRGSVDRTTNADGKTASTSGLSEGLSVYDLKARLANAGRVPLRRRAEALWRDRIPLCIEVLLAPECGVCREPLLLLERWTMSVYSHRDRDGGFNPITSQWLLNAVKSQLHFSQISAWHEQLRAKAKRDLSPSERQRKLSRETCNFKKYEANCDEARCPPERQRLNVVYGLRLLSSKPQHAFQRQPSKHAFPLTDIGNDIYLEVLLESLPRSEDVPAVPCKCYDASSSSVESEDVLAKLAELDVSTVNDDASNNSSSSSSRLKRSSYSPELAVINSETGSTSKISRKYFCSPNEPNIQVPSDTINYSMVDDRMQTTCSQNGKHRCNCDDESDQGEVNRTHRHHHHHHHRRSSRKEAEKTACGATSRRKTRTCSSSDQSDGRSSPELVRYGSLCHECRNCVYKHRKSHVAEPAVMTTTSIPILQASKFDHVNRFGSFRSHAKSLHAPLTVREFYSLKQQQNTVLKADNRVCSVCQQSGHCSCNNNDEKKSGSNSSDDDYRPSAKKLISSYTQTDDILCECGKSLVPMCFECSNVSYSSTTSEICSRNCVELQQKHAMKRSTANHDLAATVDKLTSSSSPLLDAIERIGRRREAEVIDSNCDNSISKINNCECDNNLIYSNSRNRVHSCVKKSLPHRKSTSDSKSNVYPGKENSLTTNSDLSNLESALEDDDDDDSVAAAAAVVEGFSIRKPKFKRFATAHKMDRIVNDRLVVIKKSKDKTRLTAEKAPHKSAIAPVKANGDDEDKVVYEKGDYGTVCHVEGGSDSVRAAPRAHSNQSSSSSDHCTVPSVSEMDKFRWRLDSAASMVFHSHTGLPLTSSPAPLRRGKSCFDYDSSINSVSSIKSALYGLSTADLEPLDQNLTWSPGSSPGSPSHLQMEAPTFNYHVFPKMQTSSLSINGRSKFRHGTSSGLLGSFEESVLNGRLEPAATVAGFTAEIGASGEFCPPHITLPVTVFFYALGDNTTSPYLGHINLGKKGYCVPRAGTIQVTLFNPHGTVVKMFVVMYDLQDMPPYSRTFIRQRTLWGGTCLRYLIHLRFLSSKSGKVYLHTDIRIIVSRKADIDTAAAHSLTSGVKMNFQSEMVDDYVLGETMKKSKGCKVERGTFERRSRRKKLPPDDEPLNRSNGFHEALINNNNNNNNNDDKYKVQNKSNINNLQKSPISSGNINNILSKELSYELRSYTLGPENPKYSPR